MFQRESPVRVILRCILSDTRAAGMSCVPSADGRYQSKSILRVSAPPEISRAQYYLRTDTEEKKT